MNLRDFKPSPAAMRIGAALGLLLLIILGFSLIEPRYATYRNFSAVTRHMAANGLAALGLTFVVVVRRFDLSFPGIATFTAVTMGYLIAQGLPLWAVVLAGMAVAVPIGLLNGWAISRLGLPDIVVTIGTGSIAAGMAFLYTGGQTIFENFMSSGITDLNDTKFLRLNLSVYLLLAACAAAALVLHRSRAGVAFYATGENPVSAWFSGIPTQAYVVAAFGLCAFTSMLAVLLLIASSGNAATNHGATLLMPAYASVFLGAALLGQASVLATFLGTAVITLLLDGFSLLGVPYYYSDGVVSAILLGGVVCFDEHLRGLLRRAFERRSASPARPAVVTPSVAKVQP